MPRSNVDEQVVKMSFDNSNFDQNINSSIKALNKLDASLGVLNKNNFGSLANNVDNLAKTFSVKGQIMLGVLTSLGNKIYDLGNRAFRKLTQGIRDGIGEYNTIIESTESIYQNVKQNGNTLQDVNDALDELNDYADKTIYNFGQMTRMIGMFASAGVGLKSSVSTIKGLANSAALVGANMQKAQIAWNAVSRAMSSGRFTNITWRSLELSGIAGKQFNKVITEVARTMKVKGKQTGKDIDGMIKKWGSLRESLRENWLTKDVFTEAMDIMSGALNKADLKKKGYTEKQIKELMDIAHAAEEAATRVKTFKQLMDTIGEAIGSGWAQSFRILIGDLEQAKKLYTRISNVISGFIDNNARIRNDLFNKILNVKDKTSIFQSKGWKSGRDNFRQIIENMLGIVKTFLKSVKTGFLNIFPVERIAAAARKVLDIVQKFTNALSIATGEVKDGEILWNTEDIEAMSDAIKDLIRFFRGLASAADIAWMAISQPIKAIIKRIPFFNNFFDNTNNGLIGIIKKLGDFGDKITAFRNAAKDWEIFGYIIDYFLDNIDELGKKYPILGAVLWVFNSIKNVLKGLKDGFKALNIKPLSAAFGLFKMVVTSVWNVLNAIFGVLRTAKNSIDWSWLDGPKKAIINFLKTLSDYGRGLISFEQATGKIGWVLGTFFSNLGKIFKKSDVTNKIVTASYEIEKQYSKVNDVVTKTGEKVETVFDKVKGFFSPVVELFKKMGTSGELTFDNIAKKVALIGGGVTAATVSISHLVKTFGKIKIIDNINNLLIAGIDVIKAYQKEAQSRMILNIAIAIGILAVSMAALAFIPYDKLENGLVIFTSFLTILSITLPPIINAMAKFNESLGKTRRQLDKFDVLDNLVNQVGKFGKRIATGLNARMIGKAFKDVAVSIFILVGAIAALVLLIKLDKDSVEKAVKLITHLVLTLAIAVGVLTAAMNLFSRTATTTAGAFSQFSKLVGVSGIIISMSLAVLILVGAMAALSKIEAKRLETSFVIVASLIAFLGVIAVAIAGITSNANNFNKLKKISVSISGAVIAVVAIAASFALLVKYISADQSGAWWKALLVVAGIITVFTIMVSKLIKAATMVNDPSVFKRLGSLAVIITTSVLAIAGGLYLLSYANPIPASIVTTIGILTLATVSLLAFMAVVTSKAKGDFSTSFVKVIEGIAFSISAIVVSFGVLIASVAALIATISSINISSADANKASSNIIEKLTYIAEVIEKALPKIRKLFYNIGTYAGSIFTAFTSGFINQIISVSETYNEIAEKFVNLIIDIVGKVVDVLKTRKEDVAKIIGDLVDFLGEIVTAAINAFFKKQDGSGIVDKDTVLKWIGIGGVSVAVAQAILKILGYFNTLILAIKNLKAILGGFKLMPILEKAAKVIRWIMEAGGKIVTFVKNAINAIKGAATVVKTIFFNISAEMGGAASMIGTIVVAVLGIAAAITAVIGAWKRWTGEWKDTYDMSASFLVKLEQVLVDGFEILGRIILQFFMSIPRIVIGAISYAVYGILSVLKKPGEWILKFLSLIDKENANTYNNMIDQMNMFTDSFKENGKQAFDSFTNAWAHVLDDESTEGLELLDKKFDWKAQELSKKNYETAKENSKNYAQGAADGLNESTKIVTDAVTFMDKSVMNTEKKNYDEHSPSKKSYGIYWNYILGAKNALGAGGKELEKVMNTNNQKLIKTTITGAESIYAAYDNLGLKMQDSLRKADYKDIGYNSYKSDGTAEGYKTVTLNKQLTDSILDEIDAIENLTKFEAYEYIRKKAYLLDINNYEQEAAKLTNYLYDQQVTKSALTHSTIEQFKKDTELALSDILSVEEQTNYETVKKAEETNKLLYETTDELSKKLIGKKKEEAQEIIKQELIAKGMSEEQAEEESKKMISLAVAGQKQKTTITKNGLDKAIDIFEAETEAYEASIKHQTALLNQEIEKRGKLQENAANWQKKAESGQVNSSNYRDYVDANRQLVQQNDKINGIKNELDKISKQAVERMNKKGLLNLDQFEKDYKDTYNKLNIGNKKKTGSIKDVLNNFLKDALGKLPGAPDTKTWNFPTNNNNKNLKNSKNKNPVDEAKKLKNDLEGQRADLTPTFDLDKLASEANKANGIVMSSLMAAQNASIGDYINKDSELNPFMKDRWQNVYNFTQNNYSPKALSRIDIYRQTQRQLSMSRGF